MINAEGKEFAAGAGKGRDPTTRARICDKICVDTTRGIGALGLATWEWDYEERSTIIDLDLYVYGCTLAEQ